MKSSTKSGSKVTQKSDSAPKFKAQLWRCHSQLAMHDEPLCLAQRKALFCNMRKSKSGGKFDIFKKIEQSRKAHTVLFFKDDNEVAQFFLTELCNEIKLKLRLPPFFLIRYSVNQCQQTFHFFVFVS